MVLLEFLFSSKWNVFTFNYILWAQEIIHFLYWDMGLETRLPNTFYYLICIASIYPGGFPTDKIIELEEVLWS